MVSRVVELDHEDLEFVVIDTETTGLYKNDRIIEIALIAFRGNQILEEWSTLLNPNRDVGMTSIHGITPSMISSAPNFQDVANDIFRLINGRVLVGHNLTFDARMLRQEMSRLNIDEILGKGFCTMMAARRFLSPSQSSLQDACRAFEIPVINGHSALGDARMTLNLYYSVSHDDQMMEVTLAPYSPSDLPARILERTAFTKRPDDSLTSMQAFTKKVPFPTSEEKFIAYLLLLNMALGDMRLSDGEKHELQDWAVKLGISPNELEWLHRGYLDSFVHAALRDGVITLAEREMIDSVGHALNLPVEFPEANEPISVNEEFLQVGRKICFTGQAVGSKGQPIDRNELEAMAAKVGLHPVSTVSKSGCDILVATDESSMSGKAKKAKGWGIPVISVEKFVFYCTIG